MVIKSHRALADAIAGKTILHANSLGKDSALCLAWLATYAKPKRIVSVFFERFTVHPDERKYFEYQKAKYPGVEFMKLPDPNEVTMICQGLYQPPENSRFHEELEYDAFDRGVMIRELKTEVGADYVCDGTAGYEGMGRAQKFHGKGLLIKDTIYPLGLMKKAQIVELIRTLKIRLNPTYKFYGSTFDEISYYRMRAAMKASPEFKRLVLQYFPMLRCDIFRYEVVNEEVRREAQAQVAKAQGAQGPKGAAV